MDRRRFLSSSALAGLAATVPALRGEAAKPGAGAAPASAADRPVVVDGLNVSDISDSYIQEMRAGGVDCLHKSIGLSPPSLGAMHAFLDRRDDVVLATTAAGIREAANRGHITIILGSQHSNEVESELRKTSAESLRNIANVLRARHQAGLRIQGIAYNLMNVFGGGCLEPHVGLSRAGRRLVEEMHKLGFVVDVAGHTGEQTSLDAIAISAGVPVVCTHTNAAGLNANLRATSDRVIEAIAGTGGVVGLAAISDFMMRSPDTAPRHGPVSPQATVDHLLDQFDYMKRLVGVDHVGLGTDFITGREGNFRFRDLDQNFAFNPESLSEGPLRYVKGFENISELGNVRNGLMARGWRQDEIAKVMGENWLRVYRAVWGA